MSSWEAFSAPSSAMWFYYVGQSVLGPVSLPELQSLISTGAISRETLVCPEGEENWIPLSSVLEIPEEVHAGVPPRPNVSAMPPPLPSTPTPRKRVWFSKTQIAGLGLLAGFGYHP